MQSGEWADETGEDRKPNKEGGVSIRTVAVDIWAQPYW